jgi:hypothetical protein
MQIDNTEILIKPAMFRQACVENLSILPNRVKATEWDKIVKELLERVEVIKAPTDASQMGQILAWTESYCTTFAKARTKEDMLRGKPWQSEKYIFFRSQDLFKYLKAQGCTIPAKPALLWSMFHEKGAINKTFTVNKKGFRAWGLPLELFTTQTEGFTEITLNDDEDFE